MERSASSPVSVMTSSPPSSISSQSIAEEIDVDLSSSIELEPEEDPFTPLSQTFPHSLFGPREPRSTAGSSDGSSHTTPAGTPAITLTIDSPNGSTPRLTHVPMDPPKVEQIEAPSPTLAFAQLSLNTPFPLNYKSPVISTTGGLRRGPRPIALSRSLSDNAAGLVRPLYEPRFEREAKRAKFRPGPAGALSVAVPKAKGGQWEELKSPFEIK